MSPANLRQHDPATGNISGNANSNVDLRRNRRPDRMQLPLYPVTGFFPYKTAVKAFYSKSGVLNDPVCDAFGASAQQVVLGIIVLNRVVFGLR
jgi:hypothetical protein